MFENLTEYYSHKGPQPQQCQTVYQHGELVTLFPHREDVTISEIDTLGVPGVKDYSETQITGSIIHLK